MLLTILLKRQLSDAADQRNDENEVHHSAQGSMDHVLAEETGEYMRDAAYMIAIQRVATVCHLRGWA